MKKIIALSFLALFILAVRMPIWIEPLTNDSASVAYHARLILQGEPLYGTHHATHHFPGAFYNIALAFKLFGDSDTTVKFWALLWTWLTAGSLYLLGSFFANGKTGFLAGLFYAWLAHQDWISGATGEIEIFANLLVVLAIGMTLVSLKRTSPRWMFFFVGVLCGLAFLFKMAYILPAGVPIVALVYESWINRKEISLLRGNLVRGIWFGFGFLIPIFIVVGYFTSLGLLPRLLDIFSLGREYLNDMGSQSSFILIIIIPIFILIFFNVVILIFGFGGMIRTLRNIKRVNQPIFSLYGTTIVFWFWLSIIGAGVTRYGSPYYAIMVFPALFLLAGWELTQIEEIIYKKKIVLSLIIQSGIFFMIFLASMPIYGNYYRHYISYKLKTESLDTFYSEGLFGGRGIITINELVSFIQANTIADDYIYYWSVNVQLYYYANRRSPADNLWPQYAGVTQPYQEILANKPKFIILDDNLQISPPAWLNKEIESHYVLDTSFNQQRIFKRDGP